MFHSWNLDVQAADISSRMIERARNQFGPPPSLHWVVRFRDATVDEQKPFDAALCAGNSLASVPTWRLSNWYDPANAGGRADGGVRRGACAEPVASPYGPCV